MSLYELKRREDEEFEDYHIRLFDDMPVHGLDSEEVAVILNNEYGVNYSESKWRKDYSQYRKWKDYIMSKVNDAPVIKYKETTEINKDGSQSSDKLVKMNAEQSKDADYLLEAHGFDKNKWELISARNNIWNVSAGDNPNKTLYSSRISVKPKVNGFDTEAFLEKAKKSIKPVTVKRSNDKGRHLLEIPYVDMHFGVNTFDGYQSTLDETIELIRSKCWDTVYIPIGNDLLHNNDFKGRTANGTVIEKVDMLKAWEDAFNFYSIIYEEALKNSSQVVSDYVCGNHDTEMTWAFTKTLEVKFPQVKWDTSPKNKKIFIWKDVVLISLHGDKGFNRVVDTLITKYRNVITSAKVVEIQSGHLHNQQVKDKYGITIRTLPTKAIEDDWHVENSFEGSVKTFQVFEFSEDKLKTIYHV